MKVGNKAIIAQQLTEIEARDIMLARRDAQLAAVHAQLVGGFEPVNAADPNPAAEFYPIDLPMLEEHRDREAVSALIMRHCDPDAALEQLGYPVTAMSRDERRKVAMRVFGNERVLRLLREARRPIAEAKDAIIQRQVEMALHGDADRSLKAAQFCAKIDGWYKPRRVDVRTAKLSFQQILNGPEPEKDLADFLRRLQPFDHEPGAPVKAGIAGTSDAAAIADGDALHRFVHEPQQPPASGDDPDDALDPPSPIGETPLPWHPRFGGSSKRAF